MRDARAGAQAAVAGLGAIPDPLPVVGAADNNPAAIGPVGEGPAGHGLEVAGDDGDGVGGENPGLAMPLAPGVGGVGDAHDLPAVAGARGMPPLPRDMIDMVGGVDPGAEVAGRLAGAGGAAPAVEGGARNVAALGQAAVEAFRRADGRVAPRPGGARWGLLERLWLRQDPAPLVEMGRAHRGGGGNRARRAPRIREGAPLHPRAGDPRRPAVVLDAQVGVAAAGGAGGARGAEVVPPPGGGIDAAGLIRAARNVQVAAPQVRRGGWPAGVAAPGGREGLLLALAAVRGDEERVARVPGVVEDGGR